MDISSKQFGFWTVCGKGFVFLKLSKTKLLNTSPLQLIVMQPADTVGLKSIMKFVAHSVAL